MQSVRPILQILLSLSVGFTAPIFADVLPSAVNDLILQSNSGKAYQTQVTSAVEKANAQCFDLADGVGASIATGVSGFFSRLSGGARQAAQGSGLNADAAVAANANVVDLCRSANFTCEQMVMSVGARLKTFVPNLVYEKSTALAAQNTALAQQKDQEIAAIEKDRENLARLLKSCKGSYGARIDAARASAGGALNAGVGADVTDKALAGGSGAATAADGAATTGSGETSATAKTADGKPAKRGVLDWMADNPGKTALGIGAAGLAVKYLGNKKEDDPAAEAASAVTAKEQELAKAAAADPTCQTDRSYEFSHCQKYLKSLCAKPAEMASSKCEKFADNYCGFYKKTPAKTGVADGLGTTLCQDTLAYGYCSKANREGCFSCLRQRDLATTTCQSQPAACTRTPSNAEMSNFKAKCGDDPVFMQTQWAGIVATTATTTTASTKAVPGTIANAASLQAEGGTQTAIPGVTNSSLLARNAASISSKNVELPSDVAPAQGPTALASATAAIHKLCVEGALNNCGARIGVKGSTKALY